MIPRSPKPGVSSTLVTSQWKFMPFPCHFSSAINSLGLGQAFNRATKYRIVDFIWLLFRPTDNGLMDSRPGHGRRFAFCRPGTLTNDDMILTVCASRFRQRLVGYRLTFRLLGPVSQRRRRAFSSPAALVQDEPP